MVASVDVGGRRLEEENYGVTTKGARLKTRTTNDEMGEEAKIQRLILGSPLHTPCPPHSGRAFVAGEQRGAPGVGIGGSEGNPLGDDAAYKGCNDVGDVSTEDGEM